MKFLIFLASLSLAWAQEEYHCHCATFITTEEGAELVHNLPEFIMDSCEHFEECELHCSEEFIELTNGGDLDHVTEDGNIIGQVACDTLAAEGYLDVEASEVYMYSSICHGPWLYNGFKSQTPLCCVGGEYEACP
nr:uncharacterized protein LOC128701251 [Cherax quadricarinatus]